MKKLILLVFVLPFLSIKCSLETPLPDCSGSLTLNFKPIINAQPFIINKVYELNGKKVRFSKLQFFSSSIITKIISNECKTDEEVIFINLTTLDDSLKATKGFNATIRNRAPGNYKSIILGLGVNPLLNGKTPSDFPTISPLSKSEEYWSGWKSYIFFKLEGLMDKDGDGTFETGITYHTGSDDAGYTVSIQKVYVIDSSGGLINFDLDVNKLLTGFDFNTLNKIENLSQKDDMKRLMQNLTSALSAN
jgi:hypothetical protein